MSDAWRMQRERFRLHALLFIFDNALTAGWEHDILRLT